jgi:hypothetical protein
MNRRFIMSMLLVIVVLAGGFVAGRASAAQPHMNAALEHLRTARHELEIATPDKGGHREKAMKLISDAIVETQLGIDVGRTQ